MYTQLQLRDSARLLVSVATLARMKADGEKIAAITCYDASFTALTDTAGVDVVLVGDSITLALQRAGADVVLLECIPAQLGAEITAEIDVPVIGIGAGPDTDGQILVLYDVLDITPGRKPRFVKNFMAGHDNPLAAIGSYVEEVKQRSYPAPEHCF
jgi:ketopantoate hydroxymethyltransferase